MILSEMNKTLKYVVIGAAVVLGFLVINKIQSCSGPSIDKPTQTVEQNKDLEKVTKEQEKYVPAGAKPLGVIIDKEKSQDPSKIIEKTHIIHTDPSGNTNTLKYTDIIKIKNVYGLVFEPKFYGGYTDSNLTLGLGAAIVRLNKITFDGLVSFPYVGLGTSYQITNNTFLGVGATAKYLNYKEIKDFSTYSANLQPQNSILPLVYFGARF